MNGTTSSGSGVSSSGSSPLASSNISNSASGSSATPHVSLSMPISSLGGSNSTSISATLLQSRPNRNPAAPSGTMASSSPNDTVSSPTTSKSIPNHDANPPSPSGSSQESSGVKTTSSPKTSSSIPANNVAKSSSSHTSAPTSPTVRATSSVATTPASVPTTASAPTTPVVHSAAVSFTGTITSTITDTPESTLAKPSFLSVVDSNGKTSFTAPPLVTILSSSMEPNGSFVTFTHVVANPTGFNQAIAGGHTSFMHNAGAVAGVFLVVGVVVTAIVASATFFMCRRRRRRREAHRRWLVSVNRPRPLMDESPNPFEDPRSAPSPPMRDVSRPWDAPVTWDTRPRAAQRESVQSAQSANSDLGLLNIPPIQQNNVLAEHPAEHHLVNPNEIGLAITTNESKPSLAQSSPSIYPASLPAADDDHEEAVPQPPQNPDRQRSPPPPPRPRRSHLRDAPQPQRGLLTPPGSVSDHSPVSEVAPWSATPEDREQPTIQLHGSSQLNEIMRRKTLLDIRPRSQDSVQTAR